MALDIFYLCDRDKNKECSKGILCGSDCVFCSNREYAASKDIYVGTKFDEYNICTGFLKITPKEVIELMHEAAEVAYNLDKDFKEYVDKYIVKNGITLEEALEHKIVRLYLDYLEESRK